MRILAARLGLVMALLCDGKFTANAFGLPVKLAAAGVQVGQLVAQGCLTATQHINVCGACCQCGLTVSRRKSGRLFFGVVLFQIAQRRVPAEAIPLAAAPPAGRGQVARVRGRARPGGACSPAAG